MMQFAKSDRLRQNLLQRIDNIAKSDDEKTLLIMEQTKLLLELVPEIKQMIRKISA